MKFGEQAFGNDQVVAFFLNIPIFKNS